MTIINESSLIEQWRQYEDSSSAARLTSSTLAAKRRIWRHFAKWTALRHPEIESLTALTLPVAEEYMREFRGGRAAATCNIRVYSLRDIFRVITGESTPSRNPWAAVRIASLDGHTRRELSLDEVERLVAAARGVGDEWKLLFAIAIYTGLRLGDCCRLRWESVDLTRRIIQLVPHKTMHRASSRPVTIPIHRELMDSLITAGGRLPRGFVLPKIAESFSKRRWQISRTLSRIFASACIESSVRLEGRRRLAPEATFHSLRHSFVSLAANAGVPLAVVQTIVGHASSAMTRHYYHASEAALRQAIDSIPPICGISKGHSKKASAMLSTSMSRRKIGARRHSLHFRLKRLSSLKERGLISEREFATLRGNILAEA